MDRQRWCDALWFLAWSVCSSAWCLGAAHRLGPTFDEPVYLQRGLNGWRNFSHWELLQLGTMPLAIDVQTLPLRLWEVAHGIQIDVVNDQQTALFWARTGNLVFWWLLLWYGLRVGRLLAGTWGGRLAVVFLACEPNLLAHAALATTDIAVSACLLAMLYHFRVGRDAGWFRRVGLPAIWCGLAILAKASTVVFAPICLITVEVERLVRSGALTYPAESSLLQRLNFIWRQMQPARRDLTWIGAGGLLLAVVYCGSDFRTQPSFVEWANHLPQSTFATCMVWMAENLCIFSNAFEGIVRQIKHNWHGHGMYLLGQPQSRGMWYYFPVLLTIKLSVPILLTPMAVVATRARALANWACWTALVLLAFSLTFHVQIGIRLVLPMVSIGLMGLAAAAVEAMQFARLQSARRSLAGFCTVGVLWMIIAVTAVWPHGLCYINEFWGGMAHGYELVSDSNYDWGQGVPELLAWQEQHGQTLDVWYFGRDVRTNKPPLNEVRLEQYETKEPSDVLNHLHAPYLAVSMTLIYGHADYAAQGSVAAFLRSCQPTARTTTFFIFERQALADAAQGLASRLIPVQPHREP
jgi:hypothetical protein